MTYILLTLVYTFVNVPYCAMPGVITADQKGRHALQSRRFSSAAAGSFAISGIAAAAGEHYRQRGRAGGLFRRHVRARAEAAWCCFTSLLYHTKALHL